MIPPILHQSWKNATIPSDWVSLQKTWRTYHPGWEYRFWTDEDNRSFVAQNYSELLTLYDRLALDINRAELCRYLVVKHFGGVYVDMDFECLRPIEPLLHGRSVVLGLEPASHWQRASSHEPALGRIVCNAFLASEPGHPLWDHVLGHLAANAAIPDVLRSTGTVMFTQAVNTYAESETVTVLESAELYPIDIEQARHCSPAELRDLTRDAYAVHHWTGSWWRNALIQTARDRIARKATGGQSRGEDQGAAITKEAHQ